MSLLKRALAPCLICLMTPFLEVASVKRKELSLRSKPVEIDVRPLPEEDKQPKFSGLVGDFKVTSS